jgi:hypothetical protein
LPKRTVQHAKRAAQPIIQTEASKSRSSMDLFSAKLM